MKLKTRIKRALAAFLREELLEYIGYNHNIPYMPIGERFYVEHLPFETVVMERILPIDQELQRMPYGLEELIHKCKEDFARQVVEHIHVDAQQLLNDRDFGRRSVRFVLRVQGKR